MMYYLSYTKNESGVALITGLVILVLLTAIGTYAINVTQIDQALSANLKASKQAFYLADAGIEWGKQQIRTNNTIPPSPVGSTQSLNGGSYTVTFKNILPQAAAWQYRITVEATGNIGTASKVLQAFVTKVYDMSHAAITMRGNEAHSEFEGNSFLIDGRDYDHLTGNLVTSASELLGISVPTTALEAAVEGALSSQQKDNVQGLGGTSSDPSVGVDISLPSSTITALANALCPLAQSYTPILVDTVISGNQTYGTRTSPQITCFDGLGVPGLMGVDQRGNVSGAGILIVKHADLLTRGNFHFEGLVIVTGNKVGFGMWGSGDVYGSVIINETSTDGSSYKELWLKGNSEIKRSQSALSLATGLIPLSTMSGIMSTLPTTVQQVSWTEVQK
jgi:Tfp pilus assembly protein PilX